jgi:hypothetical protein
MANSALRSHLTDVILTPDKESERAFLPTPDELSGRLFLADRGYPSVKYFHELDLADASFIVRLSRSYKPYVLAAHQEGKVAVLAKPVRLAHFLSQHKR